MKKFATVGSLLVVLFVAAVVAAVVPGATAKENAAEPPVACAGLVAQFADTLKKVVGALTAVPPVPAEGAPALGDALGLLAALQDAKCLPKPPVSALPAEEQVLGPELCLSHVMAVFAGVYSVLGKVVVGAVPPDPTKLRNEVSAVLKTVHDMVQNCGLPVPPGGLPTVPNPPA
ncbi:hypothetical protein [Saccharothrix deserti]|uniref:hypothetical protein n=1 Tax=Saccharothrix deserti TaxID=2593674 RepID=UPI00131B57D4|nr:hypothetical protein [Saccharothrix deserti]